MNYKIKYYNLILENIVDDIELGIIKVEDFQEELENLSKLLTKETS